MLALLISCSGDNAEEELPSLGNFFDPGQPEGRSETNGRGLPVLKLSADNSNLGSITVNWTLPGVYFDTDYEIYLYRVTNAPDNFVLPDPIGFLDGLNGFLSPDYVPFKGEEFVDTNIQNGQEYTYFVYVYLNGKWSSEARVNTTALTTEAALDIPEAGDFWFNFSLTYGSPPVNGQNFLTTFDAGPPGLSSPKGKFAYALEGQIMYVLDTDQNRIMIYTSPGLIQCLEFDRDSDEYFFCQAQFQGAPLQPTAVLGQADFESSYPCQDPSNTLSNNECLTVPNDLIIAEDKLIVSTVDGVKVYNDLPINGCFNVRNLSGQATERECSADKIIGKESFNDFTTYDLAVNGQEALNCPISLAYQEGDLYIGEGCGIDRVVKVSNALNDELQFCDDTTFGSARCQFSGLLFQEDYFSHRDFKSEFYNNNINYDFFSNTLDDNGAFLKKHCKNPRDIEFHTNGKMYVVCHEDFENDYGTGVLALNGRILEFNTNPLRGEIPNCNSVTFQTTGCDADRVFGQPGFDQVPNLPIGGDYNTLTYTFNQIDITQIGDQLAGVESERDQFFMWSLEENRPSGNPISYRVNDPNGANDSERNRLLPDLENLCGVDFEPNRRVVAIHDCSLSKIYEIPIIEFR